MGFIFTNLLLNIAGLTVLLFIIKLLRYQLHEKRTKILILCTTSLMIIGNMSFSISMNQSYLFDFRIIPYMLGALYGGPAVSMALLSILLAFRALIGIDVGLIAAIINYAPLVLLFVACSRRFQSSRFQIKLLIAMMCFAVYLLLSYFVFTHLIDDYQKYAVLYWQAFFLKISTIILFMLFINMLEQINRAQIKLDDMGKMELMYHLSASVSHEVRNGLTSTHGFLQLLHEEEADPKKKQYLRIALDELIRTESIIRDYLSFGKPTVKQLQPLDLQRLIDNCITLIEPLANMHSIVIHKHIQPACIKGDEGLLQQAILNICKNAIEAMPNGGDLEVQLITHHQKVVFSIRDTGIGMSDQQIAKLGTPYFSTKGKKGTGLGLMVAFRVIKELGGTILVTSELGKGTTFTITFSPAEQTSSVIHSVIHTDMKSHS